MAIPVRPTAFEIRQRPGMIRFVLLAFAGILLFAGFIHHAFPLKMIAFAGLGLAAAIIGLTSRNKPILESFGLSTWNQNTLLYILPGLALGMILGMLARNRFDLSLIPEGFTMVAAVAPLIGASEELVFRGWFQGQLHPGGRLLSIVWASAFHSCYKLLAILTLAAPLQFDFFFLIFWTFMGGMLFGTLRELSGNTIHPVIAHALFDVIFYGGLVTSPAWVWT